MKVFVVHKGLEEVSDISAAETGSGSIFRVRVSAEERSDFVDGDDDEAIPGGVSSRTQIQARGTVEKSCCVERESVD